MISRKISVTEQYENHQFHEIFNMYLFRKNEPETEDDYERICRVSNASHERETQRREFRQWIQTVHEDSSTNETQEITGTGTMTRSDSAFTMSSMTSGSKSESFTITLGAQMKAMHNLRLVASDIFTDICQFSEELEVALPQRLQTSMALYSNNLSGLVLLTDDAKVILIKVSYQVSTVWKFHNFSTTQILRELNFLDSRSAKYAILKHLEALNFDFNDFYAF